MEDSCVGWWGCDTQALSQEEVESVALTLFLELLQLNAGLLALVMREKRSFISALKSKKAVGKHANFRTYVPMFFFIVSGCAVLCSNL
nr:hypothetical protein Iba_chr02dCG11700 [Ipomoea batatas]GMC68580.1 hypothetical protein Iba_chr02fCG13260 [Ipomoea batatas]